MNGLAIGAAVIAFAVGVAAGKSGKATGEARVVTYSYVVHVEGEGLQAVDWNMTAGECAAQLAADSNVVQGKLPTPSGLCVASNDSAVSFAP